MAEKIYNWTDDPMVSGVADCNTDVVNDCLMHLKYENTSDTIQNMYETGQVEKQTRAFNQLLSMKHSTFDKSKFTIVGNPVITDDGIASGFSANDYLETNHTIDFSKTFIIEEQFMTGDSITDESAVIRTSSQQLSTGGRTEIRLKSDGSFRIVLRLNDDTSLEVVTDTGYITTNTNYKIRFTWDGSYYTLELSTNNSTFIQVERLQSDKQLYATSGFQLGIQGIFVYYGSIDLKQFSITVDGKEVFGGNKTGIDTFVINNENTEIPYTQSKTGSKIVDVAYRDRVQDLYEQFGVAPYYTIDETNQNFTLPMGEIYGMIERKGKQNNLAIGQPIIRLDNTLYSNEVRLEGAAVSKTTYADLYEVYGDTYAIEQPADDKLYLPDFRNRAIWGSNGFGYINAGLPNITGTAGVILSRDQNGAFYSDKDQTLNVGTGGWVSGMVHFNASRSSSIYGGSDTVQPPAIKVRVVTRFKDEDCPTLVESGTSDNSSSSDDILE